MLNQFISLPRKQIGASAVEYGLIVGLIAIAIAATAVLLGGNLDALFTTASDCVESAATGVANC